MDTKTPRCNPLLTEFENESGLVGFKDSDGNVVIPPTYAFTWGFSHGVAPVRLVEANPNPPKSDDENVTYNTSQWGYIDCSGKPITPFKYTSAEQFENGFALVMDKEYMRYYPEGQEAVGEGLVGAINVTGKEIFPPVYRGIRHLPEEKRFLVEAENERTMQLFDENGRPVSKKYSSISPHARQGLFPIENDDNGHGYINVDGKEIVPPIYQSVSIFKNGYAVIGQETGQGLINLKGEVLIPPKYETLSLPEDGLLRAKGYNPLLKKNLYGFLDTRGNVVVPLQYYNVSSFSEGLSLIRRNHHQPATEFIDKKGKIVLTVLGFDQIYPFSDGRAWVRKGEKSGYIDREGNVVIPISFDDASYFSDQRAQVEKNGKVGFIDTAGKVVIPITFDDEDSDYGFNNGVVKMVKNETEYYFDLDGNKLTEKQFMERRADD